MSTVVTTRKIKPKEKTKMRKSHLFMIPILIFVALIVIVINVLGDLKNVVQYIAYGICGLVVLVYLYKQITLEIELKNGEVEVVNGIISEKKKYGSYKSRTSQHKRQQFSPDHTFYFVISDKKYAVKPTDYSKFNEGDQIELIWFPKSKHLLSVNAA